MKRIFCITQPNVISFVTMITDQDEVFSSATIWGKVALLLRTGPGWALYRPQPETVEQKEPHGLQNPV